jgi:hypothetical protein
MIPIGLVTRDRHTILDMTLRSLSATNLPEDQVLVVFDDGSSKKATQNYLYTNKTVATQQNLPLTSTHWRRFVGKNIRSRQQAPGISKQITVIRLGNRSQGVVNASCKAFNWMLERFGGEQGIVMVQDDVVFHKEWLERLQVAERKPHDDRRPVGLIAGCWINKKNVEKRKPMTFVERGGITAQCYYLTPAGIEAVRPWTQRHHNYVRGFDNKFCAAVRGKTDVYRMCPAVCQHIGVESLVRPNWSWHKWNAKGRVDFSAHGPFAMANEVRSFES